ncbi:MAG TPA: hypothetical protein VGY66_15575 [Gemmataceae bacterium]|jgi:hypothetical protein|nr:hypothetical protein [Gemmataceae bacterium]
MQPNVDAAPLEEYMMMTSVKGIYRNGKIELLESPPRLAESKVIVTFLPDSDAEAPKFTPEELAELRGKFAAWEDDWNAPGMEAYDQM